MGSVLKPVVELGVGTTDGLEMKGGMLIKRPNE